MKATKTYRTLKAAMMILSVLSVATVKSQTFDLLNAQPDDKVAQSPLFSIDSNSTINEYDPTNISFPIAQTQDSTFVIAGIHNEVAAAPKAQSMPEIFSLDQNFPNPFNPSTTIRYHISNREKVSLVLYDITGREVKTLVNSEQEAGTHDVQWDGTNDNGVRTASGTYVYRMIAMNDNGSPSVEVKKMNLVR
jgi:FlgD Ig-like domain